MPSIPCVQFLKRRSAKPHPQSKHLPRRTSNLNVACSSTMESSRRRKTIVGLKGTSRQLGKKNSHYFFAPTGITMPQAGRTSAMRTLRGVASFKRRKNATTTQLVHVMWPLLDVRRRSELADRPRIWRRSEKVTRRTSNAFVSMQHQSYKRSVSVGCTCKENFSQRKKKGTGSRRGAEAF